MCINCGSDGIGRRDLMKFGAAAAVALAAASVSPAARAAESGPTALSPQEALAQLKAGNERFMSKPELCSVDLAASRAEVAGHQAPWATIVACADSRVPPELIFGGHGVGELFIARDAGNLVGVETLGTIEYAPRSWALRSSSFSLTPPAAP
jgi:carbonic anhydrase